MSEYEIANLALQQATITAGYWQTGITLAVSSSLVLYGFRGVRRASDTRGAELQADREDQRQRHTEAMKALQALIERTAPPK